LSRPEGCGPQDKSVAEQEFVVGRRANDFAVIELDFEQRVATDVARRVEQ